MMSLNSKFIIIAPLSSVSKRVRLFKITKFLNNQGVNNFIHVGWERIEGESMESHLPFNIKKKIILKGGGYGGNKIKSMYFLWILKVFFYSFSIKKENIVWALGFESAFPLLLASKIKGFRVYFDDADRFSMLFSFPYYITKILNKLEKITSRHVYKHIIPVKERYDFNSKKFFLLTNTPSKSEIDTAQCLFKQKTWIKAKVVININGWLGKGRGMNIALKLYEALEDLDVGFILAGKLDCEDAISLSLKKKVQYIGKVTNAEALASFFASDFVFTYYDPAIKINRFAASNKWGDAIKTGVGIIVNNEVITAKHLMDKNITIVHPYSDYNGLANDIRELFNNVNKIEFIKKNIDLFQDSIPYFEEQLNILFRDETK